MAAVNINDVASQLNTASRLVVSTDFFWIYMANGSQAKIWLSHSCCEHGKRVPA